MSARQINQRFRETADSNDAESGGVRVLEFVLERGCFYPPFVTATISHENPVFPFVKRLRFEIKSDAVKSMISQS